MARQRSMVGWTCAAWRRRHRSRPRNTRPPVIFSRLAFRGEAYPPNEMRDVDLREARLHHVEFRNLDMHTVRWPEGPDHVRIAPYRERLQHVIDVLSQETDTGSRVLVAVSRHMLKWAGAEQRIGVTGRQELVEDADEESARRFIELVSPTKT